MNALDTNIWICRHDTRDPVKQVLVGEPTMKPTDNTKVTVLVTRPLSLELLKKYASTKPLRRPAPRTPR